LQVEVPENIGALFAARHLKWSWTRACRNSISQRIAKICCRPFEVVAECEPGEILSLDVLEN